MVHLAYPLPTESTLDIELEHRSFPEVSFWATCVPLVGYNWCKFKNNLKKSNVHTAVNYNADVIGLFHNPIIEMVGCEEFYCENLIKFPCFRYEDLINLDSFTSEQIEDLTLKVFLEVVL